MTKKSRRITVYPDSDEWRLWEIEYGIVRSIPSSYRGQPSRVLVMVDALLGFNNMKTALDIGCGTGRNSLFLASKGIEVHGIDSSDIALDLCRKKAKQSNLYDKIHLYKQSLFNRFPFETPIFDIAIDSYVFCHFLDDRNKRKYISEATRVLKPGGYLFCSLPAIDDGYYRTVEHVKNKWGKVVVDPYTGISKQLYYKDRILYLLKNGLSLEYQLNFRFLEKIMNSTYNRSVLALVLKKTMEG